MIPSSDLKWGHARAITLLAFYESIEPLIVCVVLGHSVANMIKICFPTFILASFQNLYNLSQSFFFLVCLAFLYDLFFLLAVLRMTLSGRGWLMLVKYHL